MSENETVETGPKDFTIDAKSKKRLFLSLGGIAGVALLALSASAMIGAAKTGGSTEAAIQKAFPKTTFDRIYYEDDLGLYVGEAGDTVLYFNKGGRYALVGNILDLEQKIDLTDKRKRELMAGSALEAKAFGKALPSAAPAAQPSAQPGAQARPPKPKVIDVSAIPQENMVIHNKGGSQVLYIVSDLNCGYCRKQHDELVGTDIEVREIPIALLSQESGIKAASALCADDPAKATDAFYNKTADLQITTCDEGERKVGENTQWSQELGITGTPFLIREDGQTAGGYLDPMRLKAFLGTT